MSSKIITPNRAASRGQANGNAGADKEVINVGENIRQLHVKIDDLASYLAQYVSDADVKNQFEIVNGALEDISSKMDSLDKDSEEKSGIDLETQQFDDLMEKLSELAEIKKALGELPEINTALSELPEKINVSAGPLNEEQSNNLDERLKQLQVVADHLTAHTQKDGIPPKSEPKKSENAEKSDKSEHKEELTVRINLWCKEGKNFVRGGHELFTIGSFSSLPELEVDLQSQFKVLFKKESKARFNFSKGAVYWTKYHKIVSIKADLGSAASGEGWNEETYGPTGTTLTEWNHKEFLNLLKPQDVPTITVTIAVSKKKGKKAKKEKDEKESSSSSSSSGDDIDK